MVQKKPAVTLTRRYDGYVVDSMRGVVVLEVRPGLVVRANDSITEKVAEDLLLVAEVTVKAMK